MRSVSSFVRRAGAAIAAVGIAAALGIAAAPSASASPTNIGTATVSQAGSTWSVAYSGGLTQLTMSASGEEFTVTNNASYNIGLLVMSTGVVYDGSADCHVSANPVCVIASSNTVTFTLGNVLPGTSRNIPIAYLNSSSMWDVTMTQLTIAFPASPSGGDSVAAPAAVPASMSLQLGEGVGAAVCTSAPTGYVGQWMTLPGQGDCHKADDANAKLLGWATSASFPVAIAQRQADNKWGAYQLTDADGNVTAIFIPAGWGTFVTGANNLYPVWAQ